MALTLVSCELLLHGRLRFATQSHKHYKSIINLRNCKHLSTSNHKCYLECISNEYCGRQFYGSQHCRNLSHSARRTLLCSPKLKKQICAVSSCHFHTCIAVQSAQARLQSFSKIIDGSVDVSSKKFQKNMENYSDTKIKFDKVLALATGGGNEKARQRHTEKNKKLLVADRLKLLLDDYDDLLELSTLAGIGMEYGDIPRAGTLIGIGKIQGVQCLISANDATVKAGTMYPITVKKGLRSQEIAIENHLPIIYLVDSGGAFLPLQADIFIEGGRNFYNEAIMNSLDIPAVAIVVGSCTAGAAYIPTMAQEAVIVDKIGTIFLAGPPLVQAALGEKISAENLGGGRMHSSVSGYTDYFALDEPEAFQMGRDIVAGFNIDVPERRVDIEEPQFSSDELPGLIPSVNQHTMDIYKVLARILDGSKFHEFKAMYGTGLVTGFAHLNGYLIGVVANNGEMSGDAACKGAHFVQLCTQRNTPLLFLQNTPPDTHGMEKGEDIGKRLKGHSSLMSSVATTHVPKVTLVVGNSIGTTNYMMAGRSFNPRFMFSWPNAKIGLMPSQQLIDNMIQSRFPEGVDIPPAVRGKLMAAVEQEITDKCSALHASANLWDDGVITPEQTREVLGKCFEIIHQTPWKRPSSQDNPPLIRM